MRGSRHCQRGMTRAGTDMDGRCNDTLHCMIPTSGEAACRRWIDTVPSGKNRQTVEGSLEQLKSADRGTWRLMVANIRRVQEGRITQLDFERGAVIAPAGKHVDPRGLTGPKPWLAEIKADRTKDPRKWHRIYFGDVADVPGEVRNRLVASGMHTKTDRGERAAREAQTMSMESAMKALMWWCSVRGPSGLNVAYRWETDDPGQGDGYHIK